MLELLRIKEEKRQKEKQEMNDLAFNQWIEKTPDEEIKKLVSPWPFGFFGICSQTDGSRVFS